MCMVTINPPYMPMVRENIMLAETIQYIYDQDTKPNKCAQNIQPKSIAWSPHTMLICKFDLDTSCFDSNSSPCFTDEFLQEPGALTSFAFDGGPLMHHVDA